MLDLVNNITYVLCFFYSNIGRNQKRGEGSFHRISLVPRCDCLLPNVFKLLEKDPHHPTPPERSDQ